MTALVTETLSPVRTEMSPHVLTYGLRIGEMLRAMSA